MPFSHGQPWQLAHLAGWLACNAAEQRTELICHALDGDRIEQGSVVFPLQCPSIAMIDHIQGQVEFGNIRGYFGKLDMQPR
ncbi:hypothetical protein IGB42_04272 [Andreprevotia sp. IGB-42]|nr:hypothetical protein IGB42_04272 [Andreprevotia sp. IGB-42]